MKLHIQRLSFLFCLVFIAGVFAPLTHAAGSMYLSGSKIVAPGSTIYVSVRENSGGDPVNAVQANLTYPADKLDFVRISTSGTGFSIDAPSSGGGGTVQISRGVIGGGVTGDKLIAQVAFRVKGTDGSSATIGFGGGSALVRGTDQANIFGGGSALTLSISKSAPAPTAGLAPKVSDVSISDITYKTAVVTWTTDVSASSVVEYGLTDKYGLVAETSSPLTKTHSVTLSSEILMPGTTYHYRVKSVNAAKTEGVSPDAVFKTQGYGLQIHVTDSAGKPVTGVNVTLSLPTPETKVTDSNGLASFENIPSGKFVSVVESNGTTTTSTIDVNETPGGQSATIQIAGASSSSELNFSPYLIAGAAVIPVVALVLLFLLLRKGKTRSDTNLNSDTPTIITSSQPTKTTSPAANISQPSTTDTSSPLLYTDHQ